MDSEDDLHDVESNYYDDDSDEGFYGDEMTMDYYGSDDDADAGHVSDDDSVQRIQASRPENNYTVLKDTDILRCQDEDIASVSTVLSLSRTASSVLLRHFNWSVSNVHEAWFSDEERVRQAVGLLDSAVVPLPSSKKVTCGICFDSVSRRKIKSATCGHPFCSSCWQGYISTSIHDGPGCLSLRCPDPSCHAFVGQDLVNSVVSTEDNAKYMCYLRRSYIEDNRKTKWCPAPGCEYAVNFIGDNENYDVACLCTHGFCWNCTEEAHRPVDCGTVGKWILKNSAESENMNWILANSKPCPKCQRPIEKNHGCMHMTCTPPCKFEFCWLCLGGWKEHDERTGGFYSCNRYEAAKQEGVYDEAESKREMAKNCLERYMHYYERWASNQKSRQKALSDLHQMETVKMEKLSEVQRQPQSQLKFVIEAWQQIVECRRVLKWTYAYGFYLPDHEQAKRQFFEYLQGEAESGLERLHQCVEKELEQFLNSEGPLKEFGEFQTKLAGLTRVTRNFFENLVGALENGLSDVDSQVTTSSKNAAEPSKGKSRRSKSRSRGGAVNWSCHSCTFSNSTSATTCGMCQQSR